MYKLNFSFRASPQAPSLSPFSVRRASPPGASPVSAAQQLGSLKQWGKQLGYWGFYALYYALIVLFWGTFFMVLLFCGVGTLLGAGEDLLYRACKGVVVGLKYFGLWAPGATFVLCIMRARRERLGGQSGKPQGENIRDGTLGGQGKFCRSAKKIK